MVESRLVVGTRLTARVAAALRIIVNYGAVSVIRNVMLRLLIRADTPPRRAIFKYARRPESWLRRTVAAADSAFAKKVFSGDAAEGMLLPQSPAIEGEIERLLPWLPRQAVRINAALCIGPTYDSRALTIDAWRETSFDDARLVGEIIHRHLAEHHALQTCRWEIVETQSPLHLRRDACVPYWIGKFKSESDRPPLCPDTTEDRIEEMVVEGLVAAALGERDPLALLEVIPSVESLGFYLDRFPVREVSRGDDPPFFYRRTSFSMDFDVRGGWRIGRGALFGLGRVEPDKLGYRPEPVSDQVEEAQLL